MSFRRRANCHDVWIKHREESVAKIADIGLPSVLFESEQTLADFLTTGRRADLPADLEALPEPQFWKLVHFATSWFGYDAAAFTALERRRLRKR